MRSFQQMLLTILLLAVPAYSQFTNASLTNTPEDIAEIKKLLTEIEQAFVSRDLAPFERIYAEGYVGVRGRPIYNAGEQLIAMVRWDAAALKSGKKLDVETISFDNENPIVHMFGDAAVVTGVKKNEWRYRSSHCINRYQSTDVFTRMNGQWRLVLGHMSPIPCNPKPPQPPHPAVADIRNQSKPTKHLSPTTETELRELMSKLTETGLSGSVGVDAFAAEYVATSISNAVTNDRGPVIAALRTPTLKTGERYRDDEAFLNFGGNVAVYLFRIRSFAKNPESKPEPPVTYSVVFVKQDGAWKIAASHASTPQD